MSTYTDFGKEVKKRLIDMSKTQSWLFGRIAEETGLFVDSGYFHKIITGQRNAPKIVEAIKTILEMD